MPAFGQADERCVGEQLEPQLELGAPRRASRPRRSAAPGASASRSAGCRARRRRRARRPPANPCPRGRRSAHPPRRTPASRPGRGADVLAVRAVLARASPVAAGAGSKPPASPEVREVAKVLVDLEHDVSPTPAVAAVRPALRDVLLAAEAERAVASAPGLHADLRPVVEHGRTLAPRWYGDPPVNIGIFIFDGVEELDFVGPYEVLTSWARQAEDERELSVFTIARTSEPVTCSHGLRVIADRTWDEAPPLDVLVFPGGRVGRLTEDEPVLDWVRRTRDSGALMTSVCTGAHVYAAAGVLKDRPATTHWGSLDSLNADRPDDRSAPGRPVRRQRRCRHRGRGLSRDRHGAAPRRAARLDGPRGMGPALHAVRDAALRQLGLFAGDDDVRRSPLRRNSTRPSRVAKIVSSRPRPAPGPGRKRVPRWRTRIIPARTSWPSKIFTPRRFDLRVAPVAGRAQSFLVCH